MIKRLASWRLAMTVATATLLLGCARKPASTGSSSLTIYCAAGIRKPINALIEKFKEATPNCAVRAMYGGSGTMLAQLQLQGDGDLYVAADAVFMRQAKERGLTDVWTPMARFRPVLAVPKGNPKNIKSLADVDRDGVRFGIGDPTATAVGRLTKKILEREGRWKAIQPRIATTAATVNELATALEVGSLDAGVIWNTSADQRERVEIAAVLGGDEDIMNVPIARLKASDNAALAQQFIDLCVSAEGASAFRQYHFEPVGGPPTDLVLFCGGSMRRPVAELLPKFERAHHVTIHTQFNGCGILVGQMKTGMPGDVYYACDQSFMDEAYSGGYCKPQDAVLTMMTPVIVTAPGNPKNIHTLADLARPGLKVVLGNEQHGAVGRTAYRLLDKYNLREKVKPNIVKTAPTADLLLTDIAIGTADAGIIWDVVARGAGKRVEIVKLPADVAPPAHQPIALMSMTKQPALSKELVAYLRSDAARKVFLKYGFDRPPVAATEPAGARK